MDGIEYEALEMLQSYSWPGNVRELGNVMLRSIILAPGRMVRATDLTLSTPDEEANGFDDIADYQPAGSFERKIHDYKVKLAVSAVRENNSNKTLVARSLCISMAYLHCLIRLAKPDQPLEQHLRETASA